MAVKTNTTVAANISATAREIDFVTRFQSNWEGLLEVLNVSRPIVKAPGTILKAYNASVVLEPGTVTEGDEIPYSLASVTPASITDITLKKWAKGVSLEAITDYGAELAVRKTDEAMIAEIQEEIISDWYTLLQTGTTTSTVETLQMAIAEAIGLVRNEFKGMRKSIPNGVVAIVNMLDAYRYLGAANLIVQNQFGLTYVENFMGVDRMILSADMPSGTVCATPVDNICVYYVDPSNADYAAGGLEYTTVGATSLIGAHVNGNYSHAVGELFAVCGMSIWCEYLNGIAVVTVGESA